MKQKTRRPLKAEEVQEIVSNIVAALRSIDYDELGPLVRARMPRSETEK